MFQVPPAFTTTLGVGLRAPSEAEVTPTLGALATHAPLITRASAPLTSLGVVALRVKRLARAKQRVAGFGLASPQ